MRAKRNRPISILHESSTETIAFDSRIPTPRSGNTSPIGAHTCGRFIAALNVVSYHYSRRWLQSSSLQPETTGPLRYLQRRRTTDSQTTHSTTANRCQFFLSSVYFVLFLCEKRGRDARHVHYASAHTDY